MASAVIWGFDNTAVASGSIIPAPFEHADKTEIINIIVISFMYFTIKYLTL
jgi:hypothetical protein